MREVAFGIAGLIIGGLVGYALTRPAQPRTSPQHWEQLKRFRCVTHDGYDFTHRVKLLDAKRARFIPRDAIEEYYWDWAVFGFNDGWGGDAVDFCDVVLILVHEIHRERWYYDLAATAHSGLTVYVDNEPVLEKPRGVDPEREFLVSRILPEPAVQSLPVGVKDSAWQRV